MKASVIILTYNQESTIGRAIESVLRQRCRHEFEIVVADDCSPDATRQVAEEYARRYPDKVRLMPKMPNRGLVGNYFDAFENCRGEYISDCAGDDEWLDDSRLERQIDALDADRSLSVVFCDVEECEIFPDGGRRVALHSSMSRRRIYMQDHLKGEWLLPRVLNHTKELPYTLSAALYRRYSLMKVYEEQREIVRDPEGGIEDVPVIAALASIGDAAYLPIVGYRYYISGESVSNNLSYDKEFWFTLRTTLLTSRLASHYGVSLNDVKDHVRLKINHIASQARHAGRKDYAVLVRDCARRWGVGLPLKARLNLLLLQLCGRASDGRE